MEIIGIIIFGYLLLVGVIEYKTYRKCKLEKAVYDPSPAPSMPHYYDIPALPAAAEDLKHQIVGHGYHKAYNGELWPMWTCKCGGSDWKATGPGVTLAEVQEEARQDGASHVLNSNKAESILAQTNGKFAW